MGNEMEIAKTPGETGSGAQPVPPQADARMTGWFIAGAMVLTLGFSRQLYALAQLALEDDFYSHILLVPWITLYLIWIKRKDLAEDDRGQRTEGAERSGAWLAVVLLALGLGAILAYGLLGSRHPRLPRNDSLALATLSYVSFLLSGCLWMFGFRTVRRFAFPLGFLLVMVPWPTAATHGAAVFLQYASAEAAHLLLQISGTTVFRQGLTFHLPGIALTVAEECSGIRSTLVLLVTSMLAGYLFLHTTWKRLALTLFVIPLAILRNGFRIFTIAMLCVHVDPNMLYSPIHTRGGPIFFALSLIPFLALLWWLKKRERGRSDG